MASPAAVGTTSRALSFDGTSTIVAGGLVVGAVLGFSGNFVAPGTAVQSLLYAISAVGLILASVLLVVEHVLAGHRYAAAGFTLLALGETRILNPTDLPGGEAAFAMGVFLYAPGLLLIALSSWGPRWVRLVAALAAVPFAAHALAFLAGAEIDSTGPLAGIGYALFTLAVIGWAVTVLRAGKAAPNTDTAA